MNKSILLLHCHCKEPPPPLRLPSPRCPRHQSQSCAVATTVCRSLHIEKVNKLHLLLNVDWVHINLAVTSDVRASIGLAHATSRYSYEHSKLDDKGREVARRKGQGWGANHMRMRETSGATLACSHVVRKARKDKVPQPFVG